jgi:hypothetical protein
MQQSLRKGPAIASIAILLWMVVLALITAVGQSQDIPVFKPYPLADDYFEQIYLVQMKGQSYYLIISCRDEHMLSISLSPHKEFEEQPRFNIYGNLEDKPKMGTHSYTLYRSCEMEVQVGQGNFLEVRRKGSIDAFFVIKNVSFSNMHNTISVIDHSVKFGFGERFQNNFRVKDGKWSLWNRDKPWKVDKGLPGISDQTYGFQPVYLARSTETKLHHFVYFKTTFGLLVDVAKDGKELAYNSVGGPIHFIILTGQTHP